MASAPLSKYSKTAIVLHWTIAVLIITNVVLVTLADDLPREAKSAFMNPHKAIGISILMLSLMRLFWRLGHRPPPLPTVIPSWQAILGRTTHVIFYVLILLVPITGALMVGARPGAPPVDYFGLFTIDLPLPESKGLSDIGHDGHEILTKVLIGLVILHITGALKHQFIDRLPFIQRMWP